MCVTVRGELDAGSETGFHQAMDGLERGFSGLVIDVSGLEHCGSIGVRLLLEERRRWDAAGVALVIRLGRGRTRRLFELLGLERAFAYEDWGDPRPGDPGLGLLELR